MSRNMIEANKFLFGKLALAAKSEISEDIARQKRAVKLEKSEKGWLTNFQVKSSKHYVAGGAIVIAIGEYMGDKYLVSIGMEVDFCPDDFYEIPLNAGTFVAIVFDFDLPVIKSPDISKNLLEYVFFPIQNEGGVEYYDFNLIKLYFTGVRIYKINNNSALLVDEELGVRMAIASVLGAKNNIILNWPESALERLDYMIRDKSDCSPLHLLLRALTEIRGDAAFLSIYRCIEQLFPLPSVIGLSSELGLSRPALDVAAAIERHLGWKRREEEALISLFSDLDDCLIEDMCVSLKLGSNLDGNKKRVAKRIYELRNQCVHYRPVHSVRSALPDDEWLSLADLMIKVVQSLYKKYSSAFLFSENDREVVICDI